MSGVDPSGNYSITVTATDSLGYSGSKSIVLAKAVPTLWIGKETVRINDHLIVGGKSLLDLTYPVGSIYASTESSSPADLFGGTWTKLAGKNSYTDIHVGRVTITLPAKTAGTGWEISSGTNTKSIVSAVIPSGYEFMYYLQPISSGWIGLVYMENPGVIDAYVFGHTPGVISSGLKVVLHPVYGKPLNEWQRTA